MILLLGLFISLSVYIASRKILQPYHPVTTRDRRAQAAPRLYPHLDPFLGLDLAIQTWRDFRSGELSEGLRRRHALYGRTFLANNLGGDNIYTVEPDNIRAITTTHFSRFGKAGWVSEAAKHVGNGVLMSEGEAWKRSRAMLKPVFARTAVDEPGFMEPHVERLVGEMKRLSGEGCAVFDFHELACMFTLDVVTEFLFGQSTRCLENPRGPEGEEGMDFLSLVKKFEGPSGEFIAVGLLAWLRLMPSYMYLIGLVRGMKTWFSRKLDGIMAESNTVSTPKSPRSVFTAMKAAGIPVDRIQGELQNVFFASYDTTSAFLANLVYVLARYPGVQAKLRREVGDSLGGRHPTNHALAKMEYLQLVIMEGSRSPTLHVTGNSRSPMVPSTTEMLMRRRRLSSSPAVLTRELTLASGQGGHRPPAGRRARRARPHRRAGGSDRRMEHVHPAPGPAAVRQRLGGLQTRAMDQSGAGEGHHPGDRRGRGRQRG